MGNTKAHGKYYSKVEKYKNGNPMVFPSVTTILKNVGWNSYILQKWAVKQAGFGEDPAEVLREASRIGTCVHDMAEAYLRGTAPCLKDYSANQIEKAENGFSAFLKWRKAYDFKFLEMERVVVSEEYRYGGKTDGIGMCDGLLSILDFKTSKYLYDEHKAQLASYAKAYEEETGKVIQQYFVIQFGKEDAEFHFHPISDAHIATGWETFKHARALHELHKQFTSTTA